MSFPASDRSTPAPTHWKSAVIDEVVQYLELLLDGQFQVALFDDQGNMLHRRAGSRSSDIDVHHDLPRTMRQESADGHSFPESMDHPSVEPWLCNVACVQGMVRCGCMRLVFSDSPHIRWLALCTVHPCPDTQLIATCKLLGKLLIRERDVAHSAKRSYETIREQEVVINHISDGLLVLDRNGILKHCNNAAAKLLNFSPQASIGRPISEVLDFKLAISDVFQTQEGYLDRELQIHSPSLGLHIIDTAVPVFDESGEIVSVVNTFRRIERVKELSYRIAVDRAHYRFNSIIGSSDAIRGCIDSARKAASSDANVVLFGESGTGKEIFAQAIHAASTRAGGPFIAVNCASLPRDLVESELFGYMAGSFTGADKAGRPGKFELASGGTLFLDEIAEMPLDVQAKLLRVLQEKRVQRIGAAHTIPVDFRVIAASHQRLAAQVADGQLREDLYYRLNVIEINIPALRERVGDIPILVEEFLKRREHAHSGRLKALSESAMRQLTQYCWPGNVRELQNIIERLIHLNDEEMVDTIPDHWFRADKLVQDDGRSGSGPGHVCSLMQVEEQAIRHALSVFDTNITHTAQALGITRPTLYAKLRRYGIPVR